MIFQISFIDFVGFYSSMQTFPHFVVEVGAYSCRAGSPRNSEGAEDDFEMILLLPLPQYWNYKHAPPCPAHLFKVLKGLLEPSVDAE